MKSSIKRAISILIALIFFIGALVIYALLIRPAYEEIILLRGTLTGKQRALAEQQEAIEKVNNLIQQYQGTGRLQDVVDLSLPLNESLSSVFSQLYAIARFNNVNIEVFGVQPLAIKPNKERSLVGGLGTLRINLRLVSSYESLKNFTRGLETNIRIMDVVNLKLEPLAGAADLFVNNLAVDTYYQPWQ